MRQSSRLLGLAVLSAVMAEAILLSGCATSAAPPTSALAEDAPALRAALPVPATINPDPAVSSDLTPVVRYGRYTLIELVSEPAQRDLMRQVVEVVIPPSLDANVGDAMRHVLRRSGYRLCDTADAAALYALPLPAAHLHLGPLMLRDALLTLAGPAWAQQAEPQGNANPAPTTSSTALRLRSLHRSFTRISWRCTEFGSNSMTL